MNLPDGPLEPLFSELGALRQHFAVDGEPALRLRLAIQGWQKRAQGKQKLLANVTVWSASRHRNIAIIKSEDGTVVPLDDHVSLDTEAPTFRRLLDAMLDLNLTDVEACPAAGLVLTRGGQARALRLGSGEPFRFELEGGWTELARGARVLEDGARVAVAYAEEFLPMLSAHERLELEEWRAAFHAYAPDRIDHTWCYDRKIEVARNGDLGYVIITDFNRPEIFAIASLAGTPSPARATT